MTKNIFKLDLLLPEKWDLWDNFVNNTVGGLIFHTSKFFKIIKEAFKRSVYVLSVFQGERIVGGVVLYPQRKIGINYLTSPFYIPYNGFILSDFNESKSYRKRIELQNKILDLLRKEIESKYFFAHLNLMPTIFDYRPLILNKWEFLPTYNIFIDLQDKQDLSSLLRRNQSRNILKSKNVDYQLTSTENVDTLYDLVKNSYAYHHLIPPIRERVFKLFSAKLLQTEIGKCYTLKKDNHTAAVILVVENFPNVYTLFAGRNVHENFTNAELYLYWRLMNIYQQDGYEIFDMLGGMVPSIAYIKLGLGGKLFRYDQLYYYKSPLYKLIFQLERERIRRKRIL